MIAVFHLDPSSSILACWEFPLTSSPGRILHATGIHPDALNNHGGLGLVVHHIPLDAGDVDGYLLTLQHLAEGGILAIRVGSRSHHDKELAAGGVGGHSTGHGQHTGRMGGSFWRKPLAANSPRIS